MKSSALVQVIPASLDQMPILANLLELYVHDFSERVGLKLGADGRFGYPQLPLYWKEPNRYPFLVTVDGHWAGFVFVRKGSRISGDESVLDMAEFFIVRGHRRLGIGSSVAREIWRMFPGAWEVRVREVNPKAKEFWGRAIADFAGTTIEPASLSKDGQRWHVFSFESSHATS